VSWAKKFVELDKSIHDRDSFQSGEVELDVFFKTKAAKHMAAGISKTFVLPCLDVSSSGKRFISAFYTIAPSSIKRSDLPKNLSKKLPHYPIPVFLLAQMAVDEKYKNQGLGKITLIKILEYFCEVNEYMPAYAVIIDCINEKIINFYSQYGFKQLDVNNERTRMYLPMKTIQELFKQC